MTDRQDTVPYGHAPPGTRVYAVGDIHGQMPLLEELHGEIRRDAEARPVNRAVVVYLGDYVDRGSRSRDVIELLATGGATLFGDGFETVYLAGNHEDMMLTALADDDVGSGQTAGMMMAWLQNGGRDTLSSYGIPVDMSLPFGAMADRIRAALDQAMPDHHRDFLNALKPYHLEGGYLFVHAGIRPGVALESQSRQDLYWIRQEFLDDRTAHPWVVVHGHTPVRQPQLLTNRIGIDTGAFATGRLTCAALEDGDRRLLVVSGRPI
ncbi:MAG: metallophosphoesterase [Alphaproteobacteria bacterium]